MRLQRLRLDCVWGGVWALESSPETLLREGEGLSRLPGSRHSLGAGAREPGEWGAGAVQGAGTQKLDEGAGGEGEKAIRALGQNGKG